MSESVSIIVPAVSFFAYCSLLVFVLRQRLQRVQKIFALFLMILAIWGLISLLLYSGLVPRYTYLLYQLTAIILFVFAATYYHFTRAFMNKPSSPAVKLGYALVVLSIPLVFTGHVVESGYIEHGVLHVTLSYWAYPVAAVFIGLMGSGILSLVLQHRRLKDPLAKSRIAYVVMGFAFMLLFFLTNFAPVLSKYPLANFGNIINAVLITYAIQKYQLLDIRLVTRRGLAYFILSGVVVGIFVGFSFLLSALLPTLPIYSVVLATALTLLVVTVAYRPVTRRTQELVDRRFFGKTYDYRQFLLTYSNTMSNILNLDELAQAMLESITKAFHTRQTNLLLPDGETGDFDTKFDCRGDGGQPIPKPCFRKDNPILTWMAKEGRPLNVDSVHSIPELKGLWKDERDHLSTTELELLLPIRSRGRLVGVLALTGKTSAAPYYTEDISLLITMSNEAGIVIENAQLYADAIMRAHTDGLTGLFNHRYFHERLEEEISRSSRFGTTVSLIMMDLDLFKPYNDIYGHVAGDEVLRQIGHTVKRTVRGIDIPCRYGGEEFTIILPETRLDDAHTVAERIRKAIEVEMYTKQVPLTASLGVASWPTDGVTKEELVACADAAMYLAKAMGRNRTCLSTEVVLTEVPTVKTEANQEILGMVYALAAAVDAKDHYTYGHSKKVAQNAVALAEALELPPPKVATIRAAAMLHDVGKIGIPDETLNKVDPLTPEEWKLLRTHPQMGAQIIRHVPDLAGCVPGIQHHHERWDGTGYPSGLRGESIPLDARVMAIADAYAAMTSVRPYRKAMSPKQAIEELRRVAGTQLDPKLTDTFISITEVSLSQKVQTQ
ncbi:MAG: diguanylate cyclase [Chloroflexota bacterium]|nr:diguanylate cyclase [Chloroflexota bacterium]